MAENFNKKLFSELLKIAKGSRSINAFAIQTGVSSAHISRLERMLLDTPPSPDIIKKISEKAINVSYGELMAAAGHIELDGNATSPAGEKYKDFPKSLREELENLKDVAGNDVELTEEDKIKILTLLELQMDVINKYKKS